MLNAFPIFWRRRRARLAASFLWLGAMFTVACGGNPPGGKSSSVDDTRPPQADLLARDILTRDIDETRLVTLQGNTRPEAKPENDLGPVDDGLVVNGVLLQLKRSDAQEHQLTELIDELHKRDSTRFHQWLTAAEFGDQFGTSQADLDKITGWLRSHGLRVDGVQTSGMLIDFSGTAQQLRETFRTEIHALNVGGSRHFANISDPQIPEALAPAVAGIVSLHDFRPHAMFKPKARGPLPKLQANYTSITTGSLLQLLVVPADIATIYNLNGAFQEGYTGVGQTIAVIEDTDLYSSADWTTFRSTFGLSSYASGSLTTVHPQGASPCSDPGVTADDGEAILDAEWASASAPSAAIEVVSCADQPDTGIVTATTGILFALENLINGGSTPQIISLSYGEGEANNGATANTAFYSAYQQAVAEGISVFVCSGDAGGAYDDHGATIATHGIAVLGTASTPYNVAVGGTDFGDFYQEDGPDYYWTPTNPMTYFTPITGPSGGYAWQAYWNSTNSSTYGSALSYIPEIPWNDSCASWLQSYFDGYDSLGESCNSGLSPSSTGTTSAGGGGPSGCAIGSPSTPGVVSGSCQGNSKPSWQLAYGNPVDGVRDLPDVSMFASDGAWTHLLVICYSDPTAGRGGEPCTGLPNTWTQGGGTSFTAPMMAGIQALVNQHYGVRQGNPNPVYYSIAAGEFAANGNPACNAWLGNGIASTCTFNDITVGDIQVGCNGPDCYNPQGQTYGTLSTSLTTYEGAFIAGPGWDFATGLGSVNANNLVNSTAWTPATCSNPYLPVLTPTELYGPQGSWAILMANSKPYLGQFSKQVTMFGVTKYQFVVVQACSPA